MYVFQDVMGELRIKMNHADCNYMVALLTWDILTFNLFCTELDLEANTSSHISNITYNHKGFLHAI